MPPSVSGMLHCEYMSVSVSGELKMVVCVCMSVCVSGMLLNGCMCVYKCEDIGAEQ